jgi:hypothetical protein
MMTMGFHDARYLGLGLDLNTIVGSFFCLGLGMGFGRDGFGSFVSRKYTKFAILFVLDFRSRED